MESKTQQKNPSFHENLKALVDEYASRVYQYTQSFPKEEIFGLTSQIRRATLSVALNYIEGYARQRKAVFKNFVEISYGSLKESGYLVSFSFRQGYLSEAQRKELEILSERMGAMLWGIISKLK